MDVASRCRASCGRSQTEADEPWAVLGELLGTLRRRLRMDLAWLGRVEGDQLVLQMVRGDAARFGVDVDTRVRREGSLWAKVLCDELPSLLPDLPADPRTTGVRAVEELGLGSYAATPVLDTDGQVYGMLGCFGTDPCPGLQDSDGGFLRLLASFLSEFVIDLRRQWDARTSLWGQIRDLLDRGGPRMLFQPVVELASGRTAAVEALARFPGLSRGPDDLFIAAASVGLGLDLELRAVRNALRVLPTLPSDVILAVNASPRTVTGGLIDVLVETGTPQRIAVEITEHDYIGDSHDLLLAAETLRGHGTHIAVDDVGSCYSGLEQLLRFRPEVIKMDCFITRGIDSDPARRAVAAGLTRVAAEIGGRVVAEGIESAAELDAVVDAGIAYGQGNLLGPPTADVQDTCLGERFPVRATAGRTRHAHARLDRRL
jgi:EAL domain-containing protein (putative c-di-GMP-specific phosphodiesterase class I)